MAAIECDADHTREQLVAFLAQRLRNHSDLTLAALHAEGDREGFTVRRRDFDEARRLAGPVVRARPPARVTPATMHLANGPPASSVLPRVAGLRVACGRAAGNVNAAVVPGRQQTPAAAC